MSGVWWAGAGLLVGFLAGAMFVEFAIVRSMRRDRDEWRRRTRVLLVALRPFAPVKVRKVRTGRGWHYWACGACSPNGLLGGPWAGTATLAHTSDDAREHYLDEHLTRANVERAGRAMADVLGSERWWARG